MLQNGSVFVERVSSEHLIANVLADMVIGSGRTKSIQYVYPGETSNEIPAGKYIMVTIEIKDDDEKVG